MAAIAKKKSQKSREYQMLEYLCQQNDINIKNLKQIGPEVKKLEIFFGGYPDLIGLRFFSSLTVVRFIGQDISATTNLKHISSTLKELWICECKLQKLDGLESCTKLKSLHLYDNKITDCSQISNLSELEVLWVNNNQISSLQFLENLYSLKEINLARNLVNDQSMKQIIRWPFNTMWFNLSKNDIKEMKSLVKLVMCKNMNTLSFSDPNYGQCPICENDYYIPWISYHFKNVIRLDSKDMKDGSGASKKALKLKLEVEASLRAIEDELFEETQNINANFVPHHNLIIEHIQIISHLQIKVKRKDSKLENILAERKQFWCRLLTKFHQMRNCLSNQLQLKAELRQLKIHLCIENCLTSVTDQSDVDWITQSVKLFYCPQQMLSVGISKLNVLGCIPFYHSRIDSPGDIYFASYDKLLNADLLRNLTENAQELDECGFFQNLFVFALKLNKDEKSHLLSLIAVRAPESCRKTKLICNAKDFLQPEKHQKPFKIECACKESKIFHRVENIRLLGDYQLLAVVFVEFVNHKMFGFDSETLLENAQPTYIMDEIERDKTSFDTTIKLNFDISNQLSTDKSITTLTLSYNNIDDISPINELTQLVYLDLSFNKIQSLTTLKNVLKLQTLKVIGNNLSSWYNDLNHLRFYCSNLQQMDLRLNLWPVSEELKLEAFAKGFFKNLIECNKKNADMIDKPLDFQELFDSKFANRIFDINELPLFLNCEHWTNFLIRFGCSPISGNCMTENKLCQSVTGLNVARLNITSLQNFDHLHKLKFLTLNENPLVDISTLTSLLNLSILHLDCCNIEKLPSLKHINNLTELSLRYNFIEDLNFCKFVPSLKILNLTGNNVSSLDDIHFLTSLTVLILVRNHIEHIQDIKVLKTIVTLTALDLSANQIQQIANYRPHTVHLLRNIEVLDHFLVMNILIKYFLLSSASATGQVFLFKNKTIYFKTEEERKQSDETFGRTLNLDFLASRFDSNQLLKSTHLKLNQLGLQSVALPEDNYLHHIQSLDLSENKFKYFGDIINIKNLERLVFSANSFQRVSHVESIPDNLKILGKLKVLFLDLNNISKLQNLQIHLLPSLTELYLQNNKLTHIQGLETLSNLELLDLSYNKITSISTTSFISQHKLKFLSLAYNRLKELTHILRLESLEYLDISFNSIQSLQNMKNMDSLKHLATFKCAGNPVCKRNVYQHFIVSHLPSLRSIDEKVISSDDKEFSIQSMQSHTRKILKTTNMVHENGDEEEINRNLFSNNNSTLPTLQNQSLISSTKHSSYNNYLKSKQLGNRKPRRIEALNLSVGHSDLSNAPPANKTFQIFGRPCSIERRNMKRK